MLDLNSFFLIFIMMNTLSDILNLEIAEDFDIFQLFLKVDIGIY